MNKLQIKAYAKDTVFRPFYTPVKKDGAAGYDLRASFGMGLLNETITIPSGEFSLVPTNLVMEIPSGYYGRIAPRSGLAFKNGIDVLAGVIDSDYRGEIGIILINFGKEDLTINKGDRVAQIIIERCETVEFVLCDSSGVSETERGSNGFGSSGVK